MGMIARDAKRFGRRIELATQSDLFQCWLQASCSRIDSGLHAGTAGCKPSNDYEDWDDCDWDHLDHERLERLYDDLISEMDREYDPNPLLDDEHGWDSCDDWDQCGNPSQKWKSDKCSQGAEVKAFGDHVQRRRPSPFTAIIL